MCARPEPTPTEYYDGVYSQLYHEIVQPSRIWAISKYFLRRWRPYLRGPAEFWTVVAARQLAYRNQQRPWCQAHDSQLAAGAGLNVDHFRRRIKSQLNQTTPQAIDLFIRKGACRYRRQNGVTRPGPTRYSVRLDDPLTPADAAHLLSWLRQAGQEMPATADGVELLLAQAKQRPAEQLLAPEPGRALPRYQAVTVSDIVAYLYPEVAAAGAVQAAAEALHSHLTKPGAVHIETQYFREQWLPELGPGPALMVVELRSRGYYNSQSGERRDEITVTLPELAESLNVTRKTLGRWLNRLDDRVVAQPMGPFLTELAKERRGNQVATTWRIAMQDPLTQADWACYQEQLAAAKAAGAAPAGQKVAHTFRNSETKSRSHQLDGRDKMSLTQPKSSGQNVAHIHPAEDKKSVTAGVGQAKSRSQAAPAGQKVGAAVTKSRPYKYYLSLATALQQELKTFIAATGGPELWPDHELSVAAVLFGDKSGLAEKLQIEGGGRQALLATTLDLEELAGWYLYAVSQSWSRNPAGYLLQRIAAAEPAPLAWRQLAALPWSRARLLAAAHYYLGELPEALAELTADWRLWQRLMGELPVASWPADLSQGLTKQLAQVPAPSPDPTAVDDHLWQDALQQLALELPRSTYQQWFPETRLWITAEGHFVVGCENEYGREWLAGRLRRPIERTLEQVTGRSVLSLDFVTNERLEVQSG